MDGGRRAAAEFGLRIVQHATVICGWRRDGLARFDGARFHGFQQKQFAGHRQ
jgi:hypothetical protein